MHSPSSLATAASRLCAVYMAVYMVRGKRYRHLVCSPSDLAAKHLDGAPADGQPAQSGPSASSFVMRRRLPDAFLWLSLERERKVNLEHLMRRMRTGP